MKTMTRKYSIATALGAVTLASLLAGCGGGGNGGALTNSLSTGIVAVNGNATQGQTLTATNTLADADGLGTFSYQWQADGVAIAGATGRTLVLGEAQVGKTLSVIVTFTDGAGNRESSTSSVTGKVAFSTSNLQGIWGTGTVGGVPASMVVLASGASWLLVNNSPVSTITAALNGTDSGYAGAGTQYTSGATVAPATVSFSATATPKSALSGTITSGTVAKAFSFSYENRYETPAQLFDIAHVWRGTKNASTIQFTWTVAADGALSGTSTAGCSYAGSNVKVHADGAVSVGVFDLTLKETCSGIAKDLAGIATLSADKSVAVFAFSNAAGSEGDFLRMTQ
jgi:hypothetical protein